MVSAVSQRTRRPESSGQRGSIGARKNPATTPALGSEYLIEHQARRLARIQRNLQRGRLGLNSAGRPDANTENELKKLVDGLIIHRVSPHALPSMRRALLSAFREWVVMLIVGSPKDANEQLQAALKKLLVQDEQTAGPSAVAA